MANEKRLIDANALEEFLAEERQKKSIACCDYYDGYGDAIDNVDDWIDAQPTVDAVEVVHAHWDNNGICTLCGYPIPTDSKYDFIDKGDCLFCYHCGAKTRGNEE